MKPLKLTMKAFGSYAGEEEVDFTRFGEHGIYLITGDTGSGKTTIFDAISYALFGRASSSTRDNFKMLRSDYAERKTKTFVELSFISGGSLYSIRREIHPHIARKTEEVTYTDTVLLTLPDGTGLYKNREVEGNILDIVGLDRDQFSQIVMIAQNDFLRFLQSGTEDRVKILRRIFDTEALKLFQERLKARARLKEEERRLILREFEKYGAEPYRIKEQFAEWEQQISADQEILGQTDRLLKEYDQSRQEWAGKIAVAQNLSGLFDALVAGQEALRAHRAQTDEMDALSVTLGRGEKALHQVKPLADHYGEIEKTYNTTASELVAARACMTRAEEEWKQADQALLGLPPLKEAADRFERLRQAWEEVSERRKKLRALAGMHQKIEEQQSRLDAAEAERSELEDQIRQLPDPDQAREALEELTRDWEQTGRKLSALTMLLAEYEKIETKQHALDDCRTALTSITKKLGGLMPVEEAEAALRRLTADAENEAARLKSLQALQENYQDILLKKEALKQEQHVLLDLREAYRTMQKEYNELYEQRMLNQAGILAQDLHSGMACPVCGSTDHPCPAKVPDRDISEGKLEKVSDGLEQAKKAAEKQSMVCASLSSAADMLTAQLNEALSRQIAGGNFESAGDLLAGALAFAAAQNNELKRKQATDEAAFNKLREQVKEWTEKQAALSLECTGLLSSAVTLKERFLKDAGAFFPDMPLEKLAGPLSDLFRITQLSYDQMTWDKEKREKEYGALKAGLEAAEKKQAELTRTCIAYASETGVLRDRLVEECSAFVPDMVWEHAGAVLDALLDESEALAEELGERKAAEAAALAQLTKDREAAGKRQDDCRMEWTKAKAQAAEREKYAQSGLVKYREVQRQFKNALFAAGFEDEAAYAAALITEEEWRERSNRLAEYTERGKQIGRDIERLEADTAGKERPDPDAMMARHQELNLRSEELRQERDKIISRRDQTVRMLEELRQSAHSLSVTDREYGAVKNLSDTANGRLDFETYAQMAYFERVLRAANLRLQVMSQNRYLLLRKEESGDGRRRMGLDLEVADSYTGKSRSANSLSGGESFMASLSLALGLSDVVQQSAGGIHLDAMFIDEGFGSLDAEVLELAVRTLSDMAGNNRTIGIISHVAELRDRIDKQIRVEKTTAGSKINMIL